MRDREYASVQVFCHPRSPVWTTKRSIKRGVGDAHALPASHCGGLPTPRRHDVGSCSPLAASHQRYSWCRHKGGCSLNTSDDRLIRLDRFRQARQASEAHDLAHTSGTCGTARESRKEATACTAGYSSQPSPSSERPCLPARSHRGELRPRQSPRRRPRRSASPSKSRPSTPRCSSPSRPTTRPPRSSAWSRARSAGWACWWSARRSARLRRSTPAGDVRH
jgi:hypothetical protein